MMWHVRGKIKTLKQNWTWILYGKLKERGWRGWKCYEKVDKKKNSFFICRTWVVKYICGGFQVLCSEQNKTEQNFYCSRVNCYIILNSYIIQSKIHCSSSLLFCSSFFYIYSFTFWFWICFTFFISFSPQLTCALSMCVR